jgi:hypothetical protein
VVVSVTGAAGTCSAPSMVASYGIDDDSHLRCPDLYLSDQPRQGRGATLLYYLRERLTPSVQWRDLICREFKRCGYGQCHRDREQMRQLPGDERLHLAGGEAHARVSPCMMQGMADVIAVAPVAAKVEWIVPGTRQGRRQRLGMGLASCIVEGPRLQPIAPFSGKTGGIRPVRFRALTRCKRTLVQDSVGVSSAAR